MRAVTKLGRPVHVPEDEAKLISELVDKLDKTSSPVTLTTDDYSVELPETLISALRECARLLSEQQQVLIVPQQTDLSPQQAARVLNVSRPYVARLLDQGMIPFHRVGTHRRMSLSDVLAYRDRRDAERREDLRRLSRMSREFGIPE